MQDIYELYERIDDLDTNNPLECLIIPSNKEIDTLYEEYVQETTEPLNFDN